MKSVTYQNKLNRERVICENPKLAQWVDGVEYIPVRKEGLSHVFLMRKDVLEKVKESKITAA